MKKEIRVIIVEAGNPVITVVEKFDQSLESLQAVVGGYIEAVRVDNSITIWINEEGKLLDLEPNFYLMGKDGKPLDYIAGTALIAGTDQEGDTVSLTDQEIAEVQKRFKTRLQFMF